MRIACGKASLRANPNANINGRETETGGEIQLGRSVQPEYGRTLAPDNKIIKDPDTRRFGRGTLAVAHGRWAERACLYSLHSAARTIDSRASAKPSLAARKDIELRMVFVSLGTHCDEWCIGNVAPLSPPWAPCVRSQRPRAPGSLAGGPEPWA